MAAQLTPDERDELNELFAQDLGPLLLQGVKPAAAGERWLQTMRDIEQTRTYAQGMIDDFTLDGAVRDAKRRAGAWAKAHFRDSDGKIRSLGASRGVIVHTEEGVRYHQRRLIEFFTLAQLREEVQKLVVQRDVLDEEIIAFRRLLDVYEAHPAAKNCAEACEASGSDWRSVFYGEAAA